MTDKFPTETIQLPSKGLLYPLDNPLSSGEVEMRYMTAYHEDILTNQNYIKQGNVLDKLLQALIVSKINYNDLVIGDKNALLISARVLGYGKDYTFEYKGEQQNIDLTKLEAKYLDEKIITKGENKFKFILPSNNEELIFKILTLGDEKKINQEIEGYKKINKNNTHELSTRLKHMILSIGGNSDSKVIRDFVDNKFLASDSRALRKFIKNTQPDIDLTFIHTNEDGLEEKVEIPIGDDFFWPDINL